MKTLFMNDWTKAAASAVAGFLWTLVAPVMPYAGICTLFVLADTWTAWSLARRVRRKNPEKASGKPSSSKLGHTVGTLGKIYFVLLCAHLVQEYIVSGSGFEQYNVLKFAAGVICFQQLLSILENESSCTDSSWARKLRRYLVDKTRRHFDIEN